MACQVSGSGARSPSRQVVIWEAAVRVARLVDDADVVAAAGEHERQLGGVALQTQLADRAPRRDVIPLRGDDEDRHVDVTDADRPAAHLVLALGRKPVRPKRAGKRSPPSIVAATSASVAPRSTNRSRAWACNSTRITVLPAGARIWDRRPSNPVNNSSRVSIVDLAGCCKLRAPIQPFVLDDRMMGAVSSPSGACPQSGSALEQRSARWWRRQSKKLGGRPSMSVVDPSRWSAFRRSIPGATIAAFSAMSGLRPKSTHCQASTSYRSRPEHVAKSLKPPSLSFGDGCRLAAVGVLLKRSPTIAAPPSRGRPLSACSSPGSPAGAAEPPQQLRWSRDATGRRRAAALTSHRRGLRCKNLRGGDAEVS
jgi:hypothetical protein